MISDHEWTRFVEHFSSVFPDRAKWLKEATAKQTLAVWRGILKNFTGAELCAATTELAADGSLPKGLDGMPGAIRRQANATKNSKGSAYDSKMVRDENGEWQHKVKCLTCFDVGIVTIAHPKSLFDFVQGLLPASGARRYYAAVKCSCGQGSGSEGMLEYNPVNDCIFAQTVKPDEWDATVSAWYEARRTIPMAQRGGTDFGSYNGN